MAILIQITFCNPHGTTAAAQEAAWERAHQIAAWPGLLWKIWIADGDHNRYGGVYLFADDVSAAAYLDGPIIQQIRAIPDLSEFEVRQFTVNRSLTEITHGPID